MTRPAFQFINLLPDERSGARRGLPLAAIVGAACVTTAVAVAAGVLLDLQKKRLRDDVAALAREAGRNGADATPALDSAIARQLEQTRWRARVLGDANARLQEAARLQTGRFSDYFQALSRQTLDGVWLTGFSAEWPNGRMTLSARALSADLVPRYLKRLNEEPLFRDRRFATLEVGEREVAQQRVAEFRLDSSGIDATQRPLIGASRP